MSTQVPNPKYGVRTFDLSTGRTAQSDFIEIKGRNARSLSILEVDAECYLRFGGRGQPRIDIRDFQGQTISRPVGVQQPFGEFYIENPAGQAGDILKILFGGTIEGTPQPNVGVVTSIQDLQNIQGTGRIRKGTTTATDNVQLSLGDFRTKVDFTCDVTGNCTLTIEVQNSANNWIEFDSVSLSGDNVVQIDTAAENIRGRIDQNLTRLEAVARGLS
jgi:hypothetical protein